MKGVGERKTDVFPLFHNFCKAVEASRASQPPHLQLRKWEPREGCGFSSHCSLGAQPPGSWIRGSFCVIRPRKAAFTPGHPAIGTVPSSFPGKSPPCQGAGGGCHCSPVTPLRKVPWGLLCPRMWTRQCCSAAFWWGLRQDEAMAPGTLTHLSL